MDYKEKYEQALEKAKSWHIDAQIDFKKSLENLFPELKDDEDKDEKIRNFISNELVCLRAIDEKGTVRYNELTDAIAWLEKQNSNVDNANKEYWRGYREGKQEILDKYAELEKGQQKFADKVEPKFKVGDTIRLKNSHIEYIIESISDGHYYGKGFSIVIDGGNRDYELVEQKPANRVEPKFYEGDWITNGKLIVGQVTSFDGEYYRYMCNSLEQPLHVSNAHKWHLWTAQYAKDGDVLSDGTTIFIFKDLLSDGSVMSYCDYDTDSGESDAFCPLSMNLMCSKITPATKEQRDTLMKAMADAGYTFDFEKKELRKIIDGKQIKKNIQDNSFRRMFEQKPAWSKEDEKEVAVLEAYIRTKNWNEKRIYRALGIVDELVNKVKSLIPQTTWKPSEEQIKALEWQVANTSEESWQGKVTKELLEQLKNLSLNIKV